MFLINITADQNQTPIMPTLEVAHWRLTIDECPIDDWQDDSLFFKDYGTFSENEDFISSFTDKI